MSKYYKKKVKPINDITIKVSTKADLDIDLQERLEEQERITAKLQRRLNGWWSSQTEKRFILIADYGNLDKGKNTLSYKIELTQLNLYKEEIDKFKEGAEQVTKDFLNNLARYL
jgi:hypothetical protein